jgi:NAD-dependent DNA ligase
MIKNIFPTICPECNEPLVIEIGKSDAIKLMCKNTNCVGIQLKRLQKGIIALEINGLGPAIIEKLLKSNIEHSYDLFNPDIFNETSLIDSGEFVKGRALTKIIEAVQNVKEIPIEKAILSLQLPDIGKTYSEKIGQIISGMKPDLTGLLLSVREQLENKEIGIFKEINDTLDLFRSFGINIKYYEKKKIVETEIKKISKRVSTSDPSIDEEIRSLGWEICDINNYDVDMHICLDKNNVDTNITDNSIKVMTIKQIRLIFL